MQISKQTMNSRPMHSQLQSPLFKVPAEIRTAIYEYAFLATPDHDGTINIRSEALPSRSLPLTCRRVHQECTAMQRKAYDNFLMNDYGILGNGKHSWKMLPDFKLEINIARDNLNNIKLHDICSVSDEELRCIEHLQVVLFLNLGCSENAARSRIRLHLYKLCGVWISEVMYEHEELDEAAARHELNVKLHKLIQREFGELKYYAERTMKTVKGWAAALWPAGSRQDYLKMLLRGYMEWINSFLNEFRREFDDAQPRDESGLPHNRAARRRIKRQQVKDGTYREPPSNDYSLAPNWPEICQGGFGSLFLDIRLYFIYEDFSRDFMF